MGAAGEERGAAEITQLLAAGNPAAAATALHSSLSSMNPQEREQRLSGMSDRDLQQLGASMDKGLSAGERTDVFNALAQSLNAAQLTRVSASLNSPAERSRFADAVDRFAPASVASAFRGGASDKAAREVPTRGPGENAGARTLGQMWQSGAEPVAQALDGKSPLGTLQPEQRQQLLNVSLKG